VAEGGSASSPWAELRGQILLGTQAFVEEMAPRLGLLEGVKDVPRAQRLAARPELAALLDSSQQADAASRNRAIVDAHLAHGYTLAEIARHLGLHYSTVSRIAGLAMR